MRFLVDESLQRHVANLLADNGHNAVHVSDIGLRGAPDETVLAADDADSRILITADTDFGTLLALSGAARPSVILLRRPGRRSPACRVVMHGWENPTVTSVGAVVALGENFESLL